MKTCIKCGETKSATEFYKHDTTKDRLQSTCKACFKISRAKRYAANPEKEKSLMAAWREENIEKVRALQSAYRIANPEKFSGYASKWASLNKEYWRIKCHNRRARLREAGGKLSTDIASKLIVLQKGKCACGCKQPLGDNYHLDHIMPIALGGSNTDDNIQLLTATCNLQKGAKHPVEFMQQRGLLL